MPKSKDPAPKPDHTSLGKDADLVEVSPVVTTVHHPGQPLVTREDAEAQVDDLQLKELGPVDVNEYYGTITSHPDANYVTRSNIVRPTDAPNPDLVREYLAAQEEDRRP